MNKKDTDVPAKIEYSIWDTRTDPNLDNLKEKYAEAMESSNFKTKTTENQT